MSSKHKYMIEEILNQVGVDYEINNSKSSEELFKRTYR